MAATGQLITLLNLQNIGAAVSLATTSPDATQLYQYKSVALYAVFTYDSGGTSADAWVQTTLDGGTTWFDIANFHFLVASAKAAFNLRNQVSVTTQQTSFGLHSLTSNTSLDGLLGDQLRCQYQTTGTYGGASSLQVYALPR